MDLEEEEFNIDQQREESTKEFQKLDIEDIFVRHQYRLDQQIGKGGFSIVHLVFSLKYQQSFVAKICNSKRKENIQEIYALTRLNHPNIIQIYDYFYENDFLFIIFEYCPNGTLSSMLKKHGAIPPPLLYSYCAQILSALWFCHSKGIAHQDIKASNILVDKNNRFKLADFGLSHIYLNDKNEADLKQLSTNFGGSKAYMSPEIIARAPHDPFKSDVWALGVTFYQMASGELPWGSTDPEEMNLAISMGMAQYKGVLASVKYMKMVRRMLEVSETKRVDLSWVIKQNIFHEFFENIHSGTTNSNNNSSINFTNNNNAPNGQNDTNLANATMGRIKNAMSTEQCSMLQAYLTNVNEDFMFQNDSSFEGNFENNNNNDNDLYNFNNQSYYYNNQNQNIHNNNNNNNHNHNNNNNNNNKNSNTNHINSNHSNNNITIENSDALRLGENNTHNVNSSNRLLVGDHKMIPRMRRINESRSDNINNIDSYNYINSDNNIEEEIDSGEMRSSVGENETQKSMKKLGNCRSVKAFQNAKSISNMSAVYQIMKGAKNRSRKRINSNPTFAPDKSD